jgi:hypothetical protein
MWIEYRIHQLMNVEWIMKERLSFLESGTIMDAFLCNTT